MDVLILKLQAPMMSFGAPVVDQKGVIQDYPALSMLTGLIGNALGYDHSDVEKLDALQDRIRYAVRRDRAGSKLQDYQTVDLGQEFMLEANAWTTDGSIQSRGSSSASRGTHIRYRDYWADADYTVALALRGESGVEPTLEDIETGLNNPARPLFIGRKNCLPAQRLSAGIFSAGSLLDALRLTPLDAPARDSVCHAWWEVEPGESPPDTMRKQVTDARDWRNQIHVGQRWIAHGDIKVTATREEDRE